MSALIVDGALLQEPRLWMPGQQPLGPVKPIFPTPTTIFWDFRTPRKVLNLRDQTIIPWTEETHISWDGTAGGFGPIRASANNGNGYCDLPIPVIANGSPYTLFAVIVPIGFSFIFGILDSDSALREFQLRLDVTTGVPNYIAFNTVASAFLATSSVAATLRQPAAVVATMLGSNISLYFKGIKYTASMTGSPRGITSGVIRTMNRKVSTYNPSYGQMLWAGFDTVAWPDSLAISASLNPYQFLMPV